MSTTLTHAVRQAIRRAPCSVAKLAQEAGVAQPVLWRIQAGERAATPSVARAVAGALERWSARCASLARNIQQAPHRRTTT